MPSIYVYWVSGRTQEQKKTIVEGFTKSMVDAGIEKESVSVNFVEIPPNDFAKGGVFWSEKNKEKK